MDTALNASVTKKEFIINPFNLKFYSKEAESAFQIDNTNKSIKLIRFSMLFGLLMYALFGTIDKMLVPESADTNLIIRMTVCSFLLFGFVYSFSPSYKKIMHFVNGTLIVIGGLGIIAMISSDQSDQGYYHYAGLLITVYWAHTLIKTRFIYATIESFILFIAYITVSFIIGHPPTVVFMYNLYFLVTAILAGMFASYIIELCLKKDFWKTLLLNEKKIKIEIENERKNKELSDARELQLSMLPNELPDHPLAELAVSMDTATEVGGDFYDFHVSEDGTMTLAIGDATGHGVKAGIMVTAAKMLFSNLASKEKLVQMLDRATGTFSKLGESNMYMAMALCRLRGRNLELAGAGMPPALLYRPSKDNLEQISLNGLPLGSPVYIPFESKRVSLEPGDVVVLMSDGFPELFNSSGDMFGYDRTLDILKEVGDRSPSDIVDHFKTTAKNWLNGEHLQDDMTFVVMKMKNNLHNNTISYN